MYACANNAASPTMPEDSPSPAVEQKDGATTPPATEHSESSPTEGGSVEAPDSVCGDGKAAADEECDDGNNASNDGCSATCKRESAGPEDVCPGVAIKLTGTGAETRKASISGTTSKIYGQTAGSCGGGTGKDAVYAVLPDVTGLLTAKLTSTFDSILYARRTCDDAKTEAACNDAAGSQGGEQIKIPVTQGQPVYLNVDGYSGSSGTFTIDVEIATAFCGNGVAEAPEVCDDGNNVAGDGCAPDCSFEAGGVINDCPGQGFLLSGAGSAPRSMSFAGSTATFSSNSVTPTGCSGSGYEAVYAITPDIDGSMTAKLVASYDNATLHVRSECDVSATQLDCKEASDPLQKLELRVPVKAGLPYYVVVDSSSSAYKGTYALEVGVDPAVCGNKILDGREQCDDGNAIGATAAPPAARWRCIEGFAGAATRRDLKEPPAKPDGTKPGGARGRQRVRHSQDYGEFAANRKDARGDLRASRWAIE